MQVSTTKGTGGDLLILEEAAYVDPGFFYETVAPLLCMQQTTMIAISTLTSSVNFYSRLIKMRNKTTGAPLFNIYQVQLACDACIEQGKASQCVHRLHLIPRWQSSDRHELLKTVMQDRPDLIESELAGLAFDAAQTVFRAPDLDVMFSQPPPPPQVNEDVHLFIDPAAGGPGSDYAILSITRHKGLVTVRQGQEGPGGEAAIEGGARREGRVARGQRGDQGGEAEQQARGHAPPPARVRAHIRGGLAVQVGRAQPVDELVEPDGLVLHERGQDLVAQLVVEQARLVLAHGAGHARPGRGGREPLAHRVRLGEEHEEARAQLVQAVVLAWPHPLQRLAHPVGGVLPRDVDGRLLDQGAHVGLVGPVEHVEQDVLTPPREAGDRDRHPQGLQR